MDWLTFLSKLIESLAWPGTMCLAIWLLRQPISSLIPGLRELRYKDFQATFGDKLEEIAATADEAEIPGPTQVVVAVPATIAADAPAATAKTSIREAVARLAPISGRAAISEAWLLVDSAFDDYFSKIGMTRPPSYQGMRRAAEATLSKEALVLYQELRLLRNRAVHEREFDVTSEQAFGFAELADRIVAALRDST